MLAQDLPDSNSLAIVPKTDIEITLQSTTRLVHENWRGHVFNIAQAYGLIPLDNQDPKNWAEEAVTALFTEEQQALLVPIAETRHLAFMHGVAGKALLFKLWDLWSSGEWILMRPDGVLPEEWYWVDFAEISLQGTSGVTSDYHRKLALIVERVFNHVAIRTIADEYGEKVTPLYLINRFGALELVKMSQFFSAKPTSEEIEAMLYDAFRSENVNVTVEQHIQKKGRSTLGTEGNFFYVKELSGGGKAFQIQLDDPKHAAKVEKFLLKYGQMRFLTQQDEDNE